MKVFEQVRHQEQAASLIEGAFEAGRLAHAYLFAGPEGVGRLTAALGLAAAIVCEDDQQGYCGSCRHCSRVFSFEHPDVRITLPLLRSTSPEEVGELLQKRAEDGTTPLAVSGKAYIGISQIRDLEQRLSRRAYEDRGHVEILVGAETLRIEAANALLKTLEEPPSGTHLILLSSSVARLLPTIRSRAQLVRFRRIPPAGIAAELIRRADLDEESAKRVAAASNGSLGRALMIADAADVEEGSGLKAARELVGSLRTMSATDLLKQSSAIARKQGTDGVLQLVLELRTLVHDMGRREMSRPCLFHLPDDLPDGSDFRPGQLTRLAGLLEICERRIRRNVSASMALGAALLGGVDANREKVDAST